MKQPKDADSTWSKAQVLAICIAQTVEIFLHYGRGEESLLAGGWCGILFLAIFEFWMVNLFPHDNPYPLVVFAASFIVMCVLHRIACLSRRPDADCHLYPRYTGRPFLRRFLPLDELLIKAIEPLLVVGIGTCVYRYFSRPLGLYLILAGAMLQVYIVRAIAWERQQRRRGDVE